MRNNSEIACCRHFYITVFMVFLVLFFSETVSAIASDRMIKVGVYENAPKIFVSDTGQPSGIFIDIIAYIAKSEGWRLQYVHGTWS